YSRFSSRRSTTLASFSIARPPSPSLPSFFFNDPATTEIYTLSLHDALPIFGKPGPTLELGIDPARRAEAGYLQGLVVKAAVERRSEEHTSELQSLTNLVCRLLLEKKKTHKTLRLISKLRIFVALRVRWYEQP